MVYSSTACTCTCTIQCTACIILCIMYYTTACVCRCVPSVAVPAGWWWSAGPPLTAPQCQCGWTHQSMPRHRHCKGTNTIDTITQARISEEHSRVPYWWQLRLLWQNIVTTDSTTVTIDSTGSTGVCIMHVHVHVVVEYVIRWSTDLASPLKNFPIAMKSSWSEQLNTTHWMAIALARS